MFCGPSASPRATTAVSGSQNTLRGGANPLLMGGCEGSFCRLFGNFAESLAYSKSTFKCVLLYPLLSRFSTSEFFRANRNVMRNRPVEKELRDLFPLSTSILIRLADVISDTDKGKRSFRARKFASGKPTLSPLLLNSNKQQQQQQQQPNKFNSLFMISTILCFWTERSEDIGKLENWN